MIPVKGGYAVDVPVINVSERARREPAPSARQRIGDRDRYGNAPPAGPQAADHRAMHALSF